MSNRPSVRKIEHYFIHVRLLSSGHFKKTEIAAAKAFLYCQFPELAEVTDSEPHLSHQDIQFRLVQLMRASAQTPDQEANAALAACCLRCFISHSIALVCLELEQRYAQFGLRAMDVLPYVLSDTDPRKSKQAYAADQAQAKHHRVTADKNYRFQIPLALHIVQTFDPDKGNLIAWIKLLTLQHRELNRILAEYNIHRRTDWSILNSYTPVRVKRLLSDVLTDAELQTMTAVLESYHAIYRQARRQTRQAGKPCKEPDLDQLEAMVWDLQQRGVAYSTEQIMQTLRLLALKLRYKPIQIDIAQDDEDREQTLFLQYQQELLRECLNQAVKQVLDKHLDHLRQISDPKSPKNRAKDRLFLEAMRLFYCEGKSMSQIAQIIGRQKEYQVSRLLDLKTLRKQIRQPWHSLSCARIARLLAAYVDADQLPQQQQQIEQLIGMQIDQSIAEDQTNGYRRQRAAHTLFAEGFRSYLEGSF